MAWTDMDWQETYEERAAIREYDGGYDRGEAERLARLDIKQQQERQT